MLPQSNLKRTIGYHTLLLIAINSIMGTGIFFLPAIGARITGPASILAWCILGAFAIYISTLFAELCSMYPRAGGLYEFAKQVYPRWVAFIIGWGTLVASNVTIAMLTIGAIQYLLPLDSTLLNIAISVLFILIFNYISFKGIKTSATMLLTFAFITLGTLLLLLIPNLLHFDAANLTPFMEFAKPPLLMLTVFLIAETFFGWESPLFLTEETKNGRYVVPRVLVLATLFITAFSIIFVLSALAAMDWQVFSEASAPLHELVMRNYGKEMVSVFSILVYMSIIGSVADWVTTSPRLVLSLAKDKLFPTKFARIHPTNRTPHYAILFQTTVTTCVLFIGAGSYETLLEMLLPLLIFLYGAVVLAVWLLRIRKPRLERGFRAPGVLVGAPLVLLFFLIIIYFWSTHAEQAYHSLRIAAIFMIMGLPIYFLMELYYNPRIVAASNDLLAYVTLLTEQFLLPRSIRQRIIQRLGNYRGRTVLEFGCSVGTLTKDLAEEVGAQGKIYATDISSKSIDITSRRMQKHNHEHVTTLHDRELASRVHPDIPEVDIIVSVGTLNYLSNIDKVLHDLNYRLKKGSRICFVEYDNFFFLMQNRTWISDITMLKHIFHRNGFRVSYESHRGFLWDYLLIFGKKVSDTQGDFPEYTFSTTSPTHRVTDLREHIGSIIESHRHRILRRQLCCILYADPHFKDKSLEVSNHFNEVIERILEISFSDTPSGSVSKLLFDFDQNNIRIEAYIGMNSEEITDYTSQEGYEDYSKELLHEQRVERLTHLNGLIGQVFDGSFNVHYSSSISIHTTLPQWLLLGMFDESEERDMPALKLTIEVPLHTLQDAQVTQEETQD